MKNLLFALEEQQKCRSVCASVHFVIYNNSRLHMTLVIGGTLNTNTHT